MNAPEHTITHSTDSYPTNLKTAMEASLDLKGAVSAERLTELADSGFAPHFRIDGGPAMFKTAEVKEWAAKNLVTRVVGRPIPPFIRITHEGDPVDDPLSVPKAIRGVNGLRDITRVVTIGSGIYFLCKLGSVVYVGQSQFAAARIATHIKENIKDFDAVYFFPWPSDQLDEAEGAFIRALNPPMNGRRSGGGTVAPRPENADELLRRVGFVASAADNDNAGDCATKKFRSA